MAADSASGVGRVEAAANFAAWGGVGASHFLNSIGIHTWGDFAAMSASALSIFTLLRMAYAAWKGRKT